jgi:hypothetical protein
VGPSTPRHVVFLFTKFLLLLGSFKSRSNNICNSLSTQKNENRFTQNLSCVCDLSLYKIPHIRKYLTVALDGVVVIVLATESKIHGFKPGRGRWIFKGDKHQLQDFLRREVKSTVQCRKVLQHVNNPCSMKQKLVRKIHDHFWLSSSWFAIMCLYWLLPESSGSKSGKIRTQDGYPFEADARLCNTNSVRNSKRTPHFTITKINRLMPFKEIIAV